MARFLTEFASTPLWALLVMGCPAGNHEEYTAVAQALMRAAVAEHTRRLPAEVTDEAMVSGWFRGKVDFLVIPMKLPPLQVRFEGARITSLHDRRAAALYYDTESEHFTIFIVQTPAALSASASTYRQRTTTDRMDGHSIAVLTRGDVTYIIVADVDSDRLDMLVSQTSFP